MRVLFLGNNWVAWKIVAWLRQQEEIVGLVLHPPDRRKYGDEILRSARVDSSCVLDGAQLRRAGVTEAIKALQPDIGLSIFFGYILQSGFLDLFPAGVVNVHPAFLPYNRGAYPNVWSIVEGTPAGVTIHYLDKGIDTGDIIARGEVLVEPIDTGESLYRKLEEACVDLFKKTWPLIRRGEAPRTAQKQLEGTYHRTRDVERIDLIDLDRTYTARDLINIIRARSFPPYPGAYFIHKGRKVYLHLRLSYEHQLNEEREA